MFCSSEALGAKCIIRARSSILMSRMRRTQLASKTGRVPCCCRAYVAVVFSFLLLPCRRLTPTALPRRTVQVTP